MQLIINKSFCLSFTILSKTKKKRRSPLSVRCVFQRVFSSWDKGNSRKIYLQMIFWRGSLEESVAQYSLQSRRTPQSLITARDQ